MVRSSFLAKTEAQKLDPPLLYNILNKLVAIDLVENLQFAIPMFLMKTASLIAFFMRWGLIEN